MNFCLQATIMTDPGTADRTYIGPMTPELVEEIIEKVSSILTWAPAVLIKKADCFSGSASRELYSDAQPCVLCRKNLMPYCQQWEARRL